MPTITLTSDWNFEDYYAGAVKGRILSLVQDATVVDISHRVASYNFAQAAFIVQQTYPHFPEGTIHIIAVGTDYSESTPHVIVKANGHYFIGTDNGLFSLLFEESEIETCVSVHLKPEAIDSFQCLNVFAPLAAAIAHNTPITDLGKERDGFTRSTPILPIVEDNFISGHFIYIDSYHNALSNITIEQFEEARRGRDFVIHVQTRQNAINEISKDYSGKENGDLIALFNSVGLLEIAIIKGYAAELLSLSVNSTLRIRFSDEP